MSDIFFYVIEFLGSILSSFVFWIVLFVLLCAVALLFWYRIMKMSALSILEYTRYFSSDETFKGDTAELNEIITNNSWFPLFLIKMDFYLPEGLIIDGISSRGFINISSVFNIPPHSTVTKIHTVVGDKRGHYYLNTSTIKYLKTAFEFTNEIELYVFPDKYDHPIATSINTFKTGNDVSLYKFIEDPFLMSGIRDYHHGDPMTNINFKASSRSLKGGIQNIVCNSYDSSRSYDCMICLDLSVYPDRVTSEQEDINNIECSLQYACYLLRETVTKGGRVGFMCNIFVNRQQYIWIPCEAGPLHIKKILRSFAEISHLRKRGYSINSILYNKLNEVNNNIDIYIITPCVDMKLSETITHFRRQGKNIETIIV